MIKVLWFELRPTLSYKSYFLPGFNAMPWSASLKDFSVYSLQGSGSHVRLPILKTVHTTATISIVTKLNKPASSKARASGASKPGDAATKSSEKAQTKQSTSVANESGKTTEPLQLNNSIVIHTDMSPVRVCGCRRQVVAHVALVESMLRLGGSLKENFLSYSVSLLCIHANISVCTPLILFCLSI